MVAIALPELNHAEEWYAHAASQILADMENGVYPDGVRAQPCDASCQTSNVQSDSRIGCFRLKMRKRQCTTR